MIPFWLKLLRAHNKKHGFGLTLPFIAGAYQKQNSDKEVTLESIKSIVTSMAVETPDASYISLTVCDRLKEPVFAESSSFYKPSESYTKICSYNINDCSLFLVPTILPNNEGSIDSLSEYLWEKYGNVLQKGKFSYNKGLFAEFNDSDYELISLAKAQDDDE